MKKTLFYISSVLALVGVFVFSFVSLVQANHPPMSLRPLSGSVITEFPLDLWWQASFGAQETYNYEIYSGFINEYNPDNIVQGGMVVGLSVEILSLPGGDYTWRVQACEFQGAECEGTSNWVSSTFTVQGGSDIITDGDSPPPTAPIYPTNGATGISLSPILSWEDIIGANEGGFWNRSKGYLVRYWAQGEENNKSQKLVDVNEAQVTLAAGGNKYLWTVQSCPDIDEPTTCGPTGQTWSFTTVDCPTGQTRPHNKCQAGTCQSINYCGVSDCQIGQPCTDSPSDTFSASATWAKKECQNECSLCATQNSCTQSSASCGWDENENKCCNALENNWPPSPLGSQLTPCSLTGLVKYIFEWGIGIGGLAAFIALVMAGFQYLTSAGNAMKMKDAMGRIQSAILGLALLLGSVLIFNTINPQLTTLRIPEITIGETKISVVADQESIENLLEECKSVILFSEIGLQGGGRALNPGDELNSTSIVVKSVYISGSCTVRLYSLPNYRVDADNPAVTVSYTNEDIRTLSEHGTTQFRSVQVISLPFNQ